MNYCVDYRWLGSKSINKRLSEDPFDIDHVMNKGNSHEIMKVLNSDLFLEFKAKGLADDLALGV